MPWGLPVPISSSPPVNTAKGMTSSRVIDSVGRVCTPRSGKIQHMVTTTASVITIAICDDNSVTHHAKCMRQKTRGCSLTAVKLCCWMRISSALYSAQHLAACLKLITFVSIFCRLHRGKMDKRREAQQKRRTAVPGFEPKSSASCFPSGFAFRLP